MTAGFACLGRESPTQPSLGPRLVKGAYIAPLSCPVLQARGGPFPFSPAHTLEVISPDQPSMVKNGPFPNKVVGTLGAWRLNRRC